MKKQEQEAKEQGHQESQAMSKSLLTKELTKEAYQKYHLYLRVLQSIRGVNTSEEYCRISEQERHIGKDIRSHQGMKVSKKFIERHCKAKGRPIGARGAISRISHVLYAQEVLQRGRSHQKRRNKEEHASRGEASGRAINKGTIS